MSERTFEPVVPLPRIAELDGLRGIAILMVFGHHITMAGEAGPASGVAGVLQAAFVYGRFGVDLFFVLSGFLITSILFQDRLRPTLYQTFYWKRALRILPLYLLVLGLILLFVPDAASFVALATVFLANFAGATHFALLTPFWTLAVEEQFYLLWPVMVRRRAVESIERLSLTVAAGCFALRFLFALKGHHNYHLTFLHCDGLALGAFLACRLQRQPAAEAEKSPLRLVLGVGVSAIVLAQFLPAGGRLTAFADDLALTGATLLSCGTVGLAIRHRGAPALAWLRGSTPAFFGAISYAFYLIHLFVQQTYDAFAGTAGARSTQAYWLRIGVTFGVTTLMSVLARHAVELPVMSLRSRILPGLLPQGAEAPQGSLAGA